MRNYDGWAQRTRTGKGWVVWFEGRILFRSLPAFVVTPEERKRWVKVKLVEVAAATPGMEPGPGPEKTGLRFGKPTLPGVDPGGTGLRPAQRGRTIGKRGKRGKG